MYFLIISAIINVVLDIVFIVNFGMGVEGCGYATVIAQAVSALSVSDLYCKKISDPAAFGRRFSDFLSEHGTASGIGNSHGTAVFYYGDRNDHCAGSGQYLRSGIYGRIFSCRKTAEYYCDSIYCVWRHELPHMWVRTGGAGKMDRVHKRSTIHADHGICLECGHNGFGVLLRRRDDIVVCEQNGDRGTSCGGSLFP